MLAKGRKRSRSSLWECYFRFSNTTHNSGLSRRVLKRGAAWNPGMAGITEPLRIATLPKMAKVSRSFCQKRAQVSGNPYIVRRRFQAERLSMQAVHLLKA
jgi:hypothetical protein